MLLGIDVGYGRTKAYAGEDKQGNPITTDFHSVYKQTNKDYEAGSRGDYIHIELDGNKYYVGKYAVVNEGASVFDKTDMLRHKLCILTAIARTTDGDFTGNIALGLPIEDMDKLKSKLIALKGDYSFKYNGKPFTASIKKVSVYPQGITVFDEMTSFEDLDGTVIGIVDIGQKTIDVAWYEDTILNDEYSTSYDTMGCSFVYQRIARAVNEKLGYSIPAYKVPERLKRVEVAEIAEPFFEEFARDIDEELRRLGWNYNELDRVILVGGGAFFVKKYLKKLIPCSEMHENAAFANACGFYERSAK